MTRRMLFEGLEVSKQLGNLPQCRHKAIQFLPEPDPALLSSLVRRIRCQVVVHLAMRSDVLSKSFADRRELGADRFGIGGDVVRGERAVGDLLCEVEEVFEARRYGGGGGGGR